MYSLDNSISLKLPFFSFPAPGVYYGFGPGFFLGIAALILALFHLLAIRKGAVTGA